MSDQATPESLGAVIDRLTATIESRKGADPEKSYTASLLAGGPGLCAKKFAEEAIEAVGAAALLQRGKEKSLLTHEAGDVLFHLLAMLAACGVTPEEVAQVLKDREGTSGHEEKASRAT